MLLAFSQRLILSSKPFIFFPLIRLVSSMKSFVDFVAKELSPLTVQNHTDTAKPADGNEASSGLVKSGSLR